MNMIEIKKTLWVVFICLMGHIVALAQKYQVRPLDLEQGLSCNYVVSIAQDKYGFLWFATEEGLNRFDGNSFFTYYKQRDRQGISSSELNCVIDDAKEPVVWIGTKNDGLNSFNYQTEEWHSYKHDGKNPSSIATNDITHITPSANGKLWITTYWKGVELFDPETGRFVHFDKDRVQGLPDNQLWCVLDLGNGNLLVGHVKSGLSIIDTQHLTARNFKHNAKDIYSISGNEVICLYHDKKGTIWIGTNVGIDIYDPLSQRFLHVADQTIKNHRIFDFCELPNGNMLVATEQMGIAVLDVANKSFTASTQIPCSFISEGLEEFNLTGNSVRSLLLDKYNNVWAGFYGSGINFLTQSVAPFSTIRAGLPDQLERLTEKSVMGLVFDKNGQLWVGTDGKGLNVFSPERKRLATYEHEGGSIVAAATRDSYGNLWFGSFYQGATVKMAGGGFRKVLPDAHEDVRCFYEDDKQQMWIGTAHGIYVVDIKRMKVVNNYHLGNDMVRAICMDAQHRVWVGYFGIGIEVFSPQMKRIKSFNSTKGEKEYIPSNAVNHLMRDSQGRIWAATNEGAICFDVKHQDRHVIYDQRQGMSNIHVRAIIEDEMHNIWMSTNRGISCLKAGQAGRFINFNEKDNVVKANFNDGSVARSEQGIIYFGSAQGLCCFQPRQVLSVSRAPEPIITSLRLIRGIEQTDSVINLAIRNHISLAYDENSFAVRRMIGI
jgi:ligand-binding sensor domain-containing protein